MTSSCLQCQEAERECPRCRNKRTRRWAVKNEAARKARATRRSNRSADPTERLRDYSFWRGRASAFVSTAKQAGILPQLDGSIACVDCGKPASEYEHRDYARPLDVEPVCKSCNLRRGAAKWPQVGDFVFALVTPKTAT